MRTEKHLSILRSVILLPISRICIKIWNIYVFTGSTVAWADQKRYQLKSGDLFIAFPNQVHYYEEISFGDYLVIIPNPNIIFGLKSLLHNYIPTNNVLSVGEDNHITLLLEKIRAEKDSCNDTIIVGQLNLLLGTVIPQLTLKPHSEIANTTLKEVLRYCANNFTESITLNDVSSFTHINKYHISHLFNKNLGMTFSRYINTLRIDMACDLLENTDKALLDISEECGFGSIRSFNRIFHRL